MVREGWGASFQLCTAQPLQGWCSGCSPTTPKSLVLFLGQQAPRKHCCPAAGQGCGNRQQHSSPILCSALTLSQSPHPCPSLLTVGGQTRSICPATPVLDLLDQRFCPGSPLAAGALCQQSCPSINGFGDRCLVLWVCWSPGLPAAPPPCALGRCRLLSIAHPGHVPRPSEHSLGRGRHHDGFR